MPERRLAGVFKSTDGGESWTAVNTGLLNGVFGALAIDPGAGHALRRHAGGGRLQEHRRRGKLGGHQHRPDRPGVYALAIDPSAPATLYAGTYGGGVFKSSDGGGSWTAINTGLTDPLFSALAIDPSAPGTLYAGTGSDFRRLQEHRRRGSWRPATLA